MKRNVITLFISGIVFSIAFFLSTNLEIASNMDDMLPEDSPSLLASEDFGQYFDTQDQAILVLSMKDNEDIDTFKIQVINYLNELDDELKDKEYVHSFFYHFELSEVEEYSWAYVDDSYYDRMSTALDNHDTAQISNIMLEIQQLEEDNISGYLSSDNGLHYMAIIKPNIDFDDYANSRQVFYDELTTDINTIINNPQYSSLTVGLTGGAFIRDLESDSVAFDGLFSTLLITVAIIIVILVVFLRTLKLPIVALYPLLFGAIVASASAFLIYKTLNMFAVSFSLLLVGLGIDFAVHIISRYQEERMNDVGVNEAVDISVKETGTSIIFGASTTAFAFLTFAFAQFKAFEQMGVIAAIGIFSLCFLMLLLLPILIKVTDQRNKSTKGFHEVPYLSTILTFFLTRKWLLLSTIGAIVIALMTQIPSIEIQSSINAIYPDNIPSNDYLDIIEEDFGYSTETLVTYADSYNELLEMENNLESYHSIKEVDTISDFIPSNQADKIDILLQLDTLLKSMGQPGLDNYTLEPLTIEQLPSTIKTNFIGTDEKYKMEIVPNIDIYDAEEYKLLETQIYNETGHYPVGIPAMMNEVTSLVLQDIVIISLICITTILCVVLLLFRSIKAIIVTIIPLLLTLYTTLTLLPLLQIEMNIFSIAAYPLIIGIGIDSSIHLYHRMNTISSLPLITKVARLGKAILLTTLTTVIGFGSLSLINHPGMSNLGLTVSVGILLSFVYTILLAPILYALVTPQRNKQT